MATAQKNVTRKSHNDLRACKRFGKLEHFGGVHDDSGAKLHPTLNQLTSSLVEDCRVVPRTPHPDNKAILVDDLIFLGVTVSRIRNKDM